MRVDKVCLLIMQANPPGSVTLGTAVEERKLQEALRRGQERDHFAHPPTYPPQPALCGGTGAGRFWAYLLQPLHAEGLQALAEALFTATAPPPRPKGSRPPTGLTFTHKFAKTRSSSVIFREAASFPEDFTDASLW